MSYPPPPRGGGAVGAKKKGELNHGALMNAHPIYYLATLVFLLKAKFSTDTKTSATIARAPILAHATHPPRPRRREGLAKRPKAPPPLGGAEPLIPTP